MREKRKLNIAITILLLIIVVFTLFPLFLMFSTSLKATGTLAKKVTQIVIADFNREENGYKKIEFTADESGDFIWNAHIDQDIRKFSKLEFLYKAEGDYKFKIGLIDTLGKSSFLEISKYAIEKETEWQKVTIPINDFDLKTIDPRMVEGLAIVSDAPRSGTIYLDEIVLCIKKVTLINYVDVLVSGPFGRYFFNSFLISILVTFGNILFCSMVAYSFARKEFPGKHALFLLIIGSIMIPPQVLMVPMFILMKNIHWLNTYWALIIPALTEPFNIFLLRQYISGLPKDLEDAAIIDGANDWQVLFKVIMPLSRPALAIVGINTFMGSWNTFLYPFLLTNTTEMRTLPVGLALYKSLYSVDWTHLMAASSITAIPVIIVFLCFQRHIIAGLTAGALKG
ncbi:MAG: carbohydrate ABC transporter permease [Candidatus Omnitrophota bacterium]